MSSHTRKSHKSHKDHYSNSASEWVRGFAVHHINILIVCRGPVRKEAMDVFESLGCGYGILLSEKDSVAYPHTLAPELRDISDADRVHRVPDYTGASAEERKERIQQIIGICKDYHYTHIFAGYGFMAEDAEFVENIENAGLAFIGPASNVHRQAGAKDQAKKLARKVDVSVTPGLDNITSVTLLHKAGGTKEGLKKIADQHKLSVAESDDPEAYAEEILQESYKKGAGLLTVSDLQERAKDEVAKILKENPGKRIRLKYIGGGGGKGQRIVSAPDQVPDAVTEVLAESKATGDADNKNFLIEMNIEHTRHNEIQLIGNGKWAIALGGRDCSLQMHEQKLVELSITDELFAREIEEAKKKGQSDIAGQLEKDRQLLKDMEGQAERFAEAVGLNSASTFESIVSGDSSYFMEMNTRIQVEHRVTEMVYSLRFHNPDDKNDYFDVLSLIEAMVLCCVHPEKLPRPERIVRNHAGGEVRLNAMNDALSPHAGGTIESWSAPVQHEIRDDQGIGIRNPDTGLFIHYYLAGAYDSNIALIVSNGESRRENLERLSDILRKMEIRGSELSTNKEFHYGIINFCLSLHPMLKPDTGFTVPYLAMVGAIADEMESVDLDGAFRPIMKQVSEKFGKEGEAALTKKQTLIVRPLTELFKNPHVLAGWLARTREFTDVSGDSIEFTRNPLELLGDLYHYLRLETRKAPAAQVIWSHDQKLLNLGLSFYKDLAKEMGASVTYADIRKAMESGGSAGSLSGDLLEECRKTHAAWQTGLDILKLPVTLGKKAGFYEFTMDNHLNPVVPERFKDSALQKQMFKKLVPAPVASADTIVAASGGMFYSRESPASPQYVEVGSHFEAGQPLYIIEVMKMFNKIQAEFSGTIEEVLVDQDGVVVKKGQPVFKVKPDEEIIIETPEEASKRRKAATEELMKSVLK